MPSRVLFEVFAESGKQAFFDEAAVNFHFVQNKAEAKNRAKGKLISLSSDTLLDENALKTLLRLSLPVSGLTLKTVNAMLLKRRERS